MAFSFLDRDVEGTGAAAGAPPLLAHLTDATVRDSSLRAHIMNYFELSWLAELALGALLDRLHPQDALHGSR